MCPDPDIRYILYNNGEKQVVDYTQSDWLRQSIWDPTKEDVFLIHGYAGGDDVLPMVVLRDGAHTCGLISRYVIFRLHRIIALDPARPLIPPASRLSSGDAGAVHVLHTNAGHYGEAGRGGHVDFCINGGRIQPYCEDAEIDVQLCSHVWAVCYMAESLYPQMSKKAEPCSRRCPSGPRPGNRVGLPVFMGQSTPLTASGSYCVHDKYPPFCPTKQGEIGDKRCCLKAPDIVAPETEVSIVSTTPNLFS
ncbi:hypothetical protein NQ314_002497 [Rhamnusium bicolor]|uniref:Lipase domain-containing protein n=1 Tax=Rhamnusium bicolor TaxID=1586634 RepID=A0AAV8ZQB0_9CUCU|nr:hypothetical protein NQ314_002497 [Rhamnusium bicolor]